MDHVHYRNSDDASESEIYLVSLRQPVVGFAWVQTIDFCADGFLRVRLREDAEVP